MKSTRLALTPSAAVAEVGGFRVRVLETFVDALDTSQLLRVITPDSTEKRLVLNHNVHSLALWQRDKGFRGCFERADAVFIDGMPVAALARIGGAPVSRRHRVGVLDWIFPLFALAEEQGWKIVHLGSHEPVIARAREKILCEHPRLNISFMQGFFDRRPGSAENDRVVAEIGALDADLLLVGMGMPVQEKWLAANLAQLEVPVVVAVGGILGYLGGDRRTAPRWMGSLGVEWVFRLATEPRRLGYRYLVEPWVLLRPTVRFLKDSWARRAT